ncbi:MAG TPA: hypothetical protein DDY49_11435 [Paenibacillaceae bacterium]|nr:hypothetical protein [Paenibacillaceae bacterium]
MHRSALSNLYTIFLVLAILGVPLLLFLGTDQPLFGFFAAIIAFGILFSYGLYSRLLQKRN